MRRAAGATAAMLDSALVLMGVQVAVVAVFLVVLKAALLVVKVIFATKEVAMVVVVVVVVAFVVQVAVKLKLRMIAATWRVGVDAPWRAATPRYGLEPATRTESGKCGPQRRRRRTCRIDSNAHKKTRRCYWF